jgi:protease secretion system membrane fusion protein
MVAESNAAIADLTGNSMRVSRQVAELTQRSMARKQEYRKEIESQLADVTREVQSDAEKFVAVSADLGRMEIKSPANGQVVGLTVQTVGAVLQQDQGQGLQPVAFESRKLQPPERKLAPYDRELLALVHALLKWKHLLLGAKFTVHTDQHALKY